MPDTRSSLPRLAALLLGLATPALADGYTKADQEEAAAKQKAREAEEAHKKALRERKLAEVNATMIKAVRKSMPRETAGKTDEEVLRMMRSPPPRQ